MFEQCVCVDVLEKKVINGKQSILLAQGDWNGMYFEHSEGEFKISAVGDGWVRINIKYCPFCGVKLVEDFDYEELDGYME